MAKLPDQWRKVVASCRGEVVQIKDVFKLNPLGKDCMQDHVWGSLLLWLLKSGSLNHWRSTKQIYLYVKMNVHLAFNLISLPHWGILRLVCNQCKEKISTSCDHQ